MTQPRILPFRRASASGDGADSTPHMTGPAFCNRCGYEWVAVVPAGSLWLECPACSSENGLLRYRVEPDEGDLIWSCRCGGRVFYFTPDGGFCYNCGTQQVFP